MSHKNADRLSLAIDAYLSGDDSDAGDPLVEVLDALPMVEVLDALAAGFPGIGSEDARERVRRRLAGVAPAPKSPQVLLLERAADELDLLRRRFVEDEYVPWPSIVGGVAVAAAAIGLAVWLRRRGLEAEAA